MIGIAQDAASAAQHLWSNWDDVLVGATALGLIAHAVNTFPTPSNAYGRWILGVIQFFVGQRIAGQNTMKGQDSTIVATPVAERGQNVTAQIKPPDVISQSDKNNGEAL